VWSIKGPYPSGRRYEIYFPPSLRELLELSTHP
jgi:hypothetical protein